MANMKLGNVWLRNYPLCYATQERPLKQLEAFLHYKGTVQKYY